MPRTCSIARALEIVGEKWSLLVIREAFLGCYRFNEIQENTGAPKDILTDRLKKLVAAEVLERVQYEEHPPRYEYRLTSAGLDFFGALTMLREWGDRHCVDEPPAVFVHKCGSPLESRIVCRTCGEPATYRNVRSRPASAGESLG
jgi:DNA-binding HxlR family transcriptional regulator